MPAWTADFMTPQSARKWTRPPLRVVDGTGMAAEGARMSPLEGLAGR